MKTPEQQVIDHLYAQVRELITAAEQIPADKRPQPVELMIMDLKDAIRDYEIEKEIEHERSRGR